MNSIQYQRQRADHAKRYLLRVIQDVSSEEAYLFSSPTWPKHKWHIGQDGSIAGLVYHVIAWKILTLPVLEGHPVNLDVSEFNVQSAPDFSNWSSISSWAVEVSENWYMRLSELSDETIESSFCTWDNGESVPLSRIITDIYEHDIQHAAQIEYLLSRIEAQRAENNSA